MKQTRQWLWLAGIAAIFLVGGCQTDREGVKVNLTQLRKLYRTYHDPQPSRRNVEGLLAVMPAEQHNDLGVLYEREGRLTEAKQAYERAIEKNYRFTRAYINLGNVHRQQGDFQQAVMRYRQALTLEPNNFEAANNFADVCAAQNVNIDEAIQKLTRCLPTAGDKEPYGLDTLGLLQHLQDADTEAVQSLERALSLTQQPTHIAFQDKALHAAIHHHLALVYQALGDVEKATMADDQARTLGWIDIDLVSHEKINQKPETRN